MELTDFELNYIDKWLSEASVKYKDGSPAVNLGLIITVFFKDGHTSEVRRKMVECVDRFYGEFKPALKKRSQKTGLASLRKITPKSDKKFSTQRLKRFFPGI